MNLMRSSSAGRFKASVTGSSAFRSARYAFQCFRTLSYIFTAVSFVDADHHPLAALFPPHEVRHQVLGDFLQAIVTGNQVVFSGKLSLQLLLLFVIQFGLLDQVRPGLP